jgi:hypothetical protein
VRLAPVPEGAEPASVGITDVSCSSAVHCAAVGSYRTRAGHGRALVEDLIPSSSWRPVPLAVPDGLSAFDDIALADVSCVADRCLAEGRVFYRPHNHEPQTLLVARYG